MHEIHKRDKVKEVFHITDNDGRELTVESILDPGEALPSWNRARNSIIRAQTAGTKDTEAMGRAMMLDIVPHTQNVLLPKLEAESAKRREAMIEIYRSSPRRRKL